MFVIRLPNGNLKVPQTAIGHDGRIIGDAYVEIGPQDADYARLAAQALSPEEAQQRRERWRQDDEALRQEFLEFARLNGDPAWPDNGTDAGERLWPPGPVPAAAISRVWCLGRWVALRCWLAVAAK